VNWWPQSSGRLHACVTRVTCCCVSKADMGTVGDSHACCAV
jgi:hypothetical protein